MWAPAEPGTAGPGVLQGPWSCCCPRLAAPASRRAPAWLSASPCLPLWAISCARAWPGRMPVQPTWCASSRMICSTRRTMLPMTTSARTAHLELTALRAGRAACSTVLTEGLGCLDVRAPVPHVVQQGLGISVTPGGDQQPEEHGGPLGSGQRPLYLPPPQLAAQGLSLVRQAHAA